MKRSFAVALTVIVLVLPWGGDLASARDYSQPFPNVIGGGNGIATWVHAGADGTYYWHFGEYAYSFDGHFGQVGDTPLLGDFDGDGAADVAVYRPGSPASTWYIAFSSGGVGEIPWGDAGSGDVPVIGDYDGDGIIDIAVYRPGDPASTWFARLSSGGFDVRQFGDAGLGDGIAPADYDCDGKVDIAVRRPQPDGSTVFYLWSSFLGQVFYNHYGQTTDLFSAGDYDGDDCSDFVLFRLEGNQWHLYVDSFSGFYSITIEGLANGVHPFFATVNSVAETVNTWSDWGDYGHFTRDGRFDWGSRSGSPGDIAVNAQGVRTMP
jgi:hypothetical protein